MPYVSSKPPAQATADTIARSGRRLTSPITTRITIPVVRVVHRIPRGDSITLALTLLLDSDEALSLAEQVRGRALTIVGGPYPSGEPEKFMDAFDLVAIGEGEETIVQVMEHLGDRCFEQIPGLAFKRDGEVVKTEPRTRSKD